MHTEILDKSRKQLLGALAELLENTSDKKGYYHAVPRRHYELRPFVKNT